MVKYGKMAKYIDADKMLKEYEHSIYDTNDLAEMLYYMPAADVIEVKHGRWIEEDDAIIHGHCSSCGWNAIWQETDVFGMPYCPNCGSRMVDEVKDV